VLRTFLIPAIALSLGACSSEPPLAHSGARPAVKLVGSWKLGDSPGREARFSPDSKLLAASTAAGDIVIRRTSDWKAVRRLSHPNGATALAFNTDSRLLFTTGYDGWVRAWDVPSGAERWREQLSYQPIWSIDISSDGRWLALAGEDKAIRLVPLGRTKPRVRVLRGHERNIWEVRFSSDGQRLASGSFDQTARLWNLAAPGSKQLLGHQQAVVALDFSPDGKQLATGGDDSTIRLWNGRDGKPSTVISAGNHVYKLDFSPDGRWLAAGGRARGAIGTFWYQLTHGGSAATPVRIWRVSDGAQVAALPHPTDVFATAYSPDGRYLATADNDGTLRIWTMN
jgi:WD40 repeat protein